MAKDFSTPFADLLPPLSTEEFEALKADIKERGVLHPVFKDEDGNILDGHHRLKIDPNAPVIVIRSLTEAEKKAFVYRANFTRRNLSPSQKDQARRKMKEVAEALRAEDKRKWTQAATARVLGVSQQTVSDWLSTNTGAGNGCTPDARVKVAPTEAPKILDRLERGEPQAQVAADYGVSRQSVSTIATKERKHREAKQTRETRAKQIKGDSGVICGDFRTKGSVVADASVDLIFTDPPYDEDAVGLFVDLLEFAERVLVPGGWLLSYSGHAHLSRVFMGLASAKLEYAWTFCVLHDGGDLRFRKLKIQNGWKPVIALFKPPLSVAWDWFPDVVSGGKEKDLHEWQQAESEAAHFIQRLCPEGGFVCDPFAGSGTSLAAAKRLGRRWIGFEKDAEHAKSARVRLEEVA